MSAQIVIRMWKDVRNGLISEVEKIPDDQFSFRATPETRSIAEVIHHVDRSAKDPRRRDVPRRQRLSGGSRLPITRKNMRRAYEMRVDKQALVELLRSSMEDAAPCIRSYAEKWDEPMAALDGQDHHERRDTDVCGESRDVSPRPAHRL